jgi:hypothetical protein
MYYKKIYITCGVLLKVVKIFIRLILILIKDFYKKN